MFTYTNRSRLPIGCVVVLGLFAAASASAADLPVKAPAYRAPVAPTFTWSGCYVGVSGGLFSPRDSSVPISGSPDTVLSQTLGNVPFSLTPSSDNDWLIGGQIGCNQQHNNIVLGIETDLSYVDSTRSASVTQGFANVTTRFTEDVDYFGTVRGRIGLVVDRSLWFATGGLAYGRVKSDAIIFPGPGVVGATLAGSDSQTRVGWTLGGGAEFAFWDRWSLKAEYLYYDLGSDTLNIATVSGTPFQTATFGHDTKGHIIRGGLNYRF